jgi:putative Mg2+ transporter-C (MgtC) family protein
VIAKILGLRTFPVVAVASCGFCLIALELFERESLAHARIIQGLMTGIGFVGGGAILKERNTVRGTATAASIWATGAVGASVAYEVYELALIMSIVTFLTLRLLRPVERSVRRRVKEVPPDEQT